MKNLIRIFFFILVILSLPLGLAGSSLSEDDAQRIDKALFSLASKYNIPDYAVIVVDDKDILYSSDKDKDNAGKNYLIGSCSKSFTALTILKLVREEYINLDSPVKTYLPWFEMKNRDYSNKVTVRHLLNHKSGFERQSDYFDVKTDDSKTFTRGLAGYIQTIDTKTAPGAIFKYSNLNYVLLGLIIEQITSQSYASCLYYSVLPSIGMNNTFLTRSDNYANNLIPSYQYSLCMVPFKSSNYYYSDFLVPAGYISSNISDIGKYLQFMLKKTVTLKGDTLLPEKYFSELTGMGNVGYAMGWFAYQLDSVQVINHSGLDENFGSSLAFYPGKNLGIAVLCNINSLEFCGQADKAIQSILLKRPSTDPGFSFEITLRWVTFLIAFFVILGLFYNFFRWRRKEFRFGKISGIINHIRLAGGIALSILLLLVFTGNYQMSTGNIIRYQPDIGWALVIIAITGSISSILRYFAAGKVE